jgi:hypothetical protein
MTNAKFEQTFCAMGFIAFSCTIGYGKHAFWPTGGEANKSQNLISKYQTNPKRLNRKSLRWLGFGAFGYWNFDFV